MVVWLCVLAVGAASLAVRLLPFLAVERFGLPPRMADALRHAGTGAVTALVVLAVVGSGAGSRPDPAVLLAVGVGALLAWRGRSMLWVVGAGGCAYAALSLPLA
ncbi:AzlD domain-containing protein [Geodermatophilus sp. YIM 151500]|uniref:AzlD domain-containing protein n=1 Tax=Geodermatophilus sp. YIM 151500 TaxID=2984531 RepID=UPI0021E40CE0|nr:AzlD domain-containing protein [Geodermatophilus sp. YIM 151500]MCV2491280.1 AzlD domain-containing protein [Geodermatophilus sp. YIM 151500]